MHDREVIGNGFDRLVVYPKVVRRPRVIVFRGVP